jgi:hypothetical protein
MGVGGHGPGEKPPSWKLPCNYPERTSFPGLAADESAAVAECGTDVARGGRGPASPPPVRGRRALSFEGLFVAGIGGSYPLGNRERREERRGEEELGAGAAGLGRGCMSGRSLVCHRAVTAETLCLLTSKAAGAAWTTFEAMPGPRLWSL